MFTTPERRWRNLATILVLGPVVAMFFFGSQLVFGEIHPLDMQAHLRAYAAVGAIASFAAAIIYFLFWIVSPPK
jgi:hypothetical protein